MSDVELHDEALPLKDEITISVSPPQPMTVTLSNGEQEVLDIGDTLIQNVDGTHEVIRDKRSMKPKLTLADIKPPIAIEWSTSKSESGALGRRAVIVEKRGPKLLTDRGEWLHWATINYYADVKISDVGLQQGAAI